MLIAGAALSVIGSQRAPAEAAPGPSSGAQPTQASGTVMDTTSAVRAPLKDVLVSNGRDIVRTAGDGRFSLPVEPGQVVFMIKPSGFRVPIDPTTNLPRIAYVHDPEGTPASLGYRYAGLAPTGALPASIDFELTRVDEPQKFDVLLFTDPQPESTAEIAFIRDDVVCGLIGTDAAFGITCGDIAFDDLSMYPRINAIIGRIGLPWWNIGGNHDLDFEAPDANRSRDTYKRVFGAPYCAHEHADALFVMLDNVDYLGAANLKGEDQPNYRGFFPPDQLRFVENLLALTPKDKLVVFVMHVPLRTYLGTDPARNTVNAADLLKLIGDRPAVSFSGHTHSTEHHYLGVADGFSGPVPHHHHVLTAVSGSWWSGPLDHRGIASADSYDGTPNGHHVLTIDGATYTTRYVSAAEAGRQMRISLESQYHQHDKAVEFELPMSELLRSPITATQAAGTRLVVNLFDGGPKSRVSFSLDGGAAIEMARVSRPDPFVQQVYGRHAETMKKWVKPQNCSHLWSAALPAGLAIGTYALKVSARDEYDRPHAESMVLEVV